MHNTIELLLSGDSDVLEYYTNAKERWKKILSENEGSTSDELAKVLTREQIWFEHNCGTRWVGQEIMAVTGIAQFYSTQRGFDDKRELALHIYESFMKSYCSLEVKGLASDVAKDYYLIEEQPYAY